MNVRPATRDDLAALAELYGSVEEAINGRPTRLDAASVDGWLHTVAFETNTWLFEEAGRLVAGAFAQAFGRRGNRRGSAFGVGASVHGSWI